MKTITLTDTAYRRLKEWKIGRGDSFSDVVLKIVPERGTLEQMLDDVAHLPPLSKENVKVMEEAAEWGRKPSGHREPWTS